MIQRIQSVFLLVVSLISVLMMITPFQAILNSPTKDSVSSYPIIFYTLIGIAFLSFGNIFLYFNRRLQIKITWACIGLSLLVLAQLFTLYTNALKDQISFFTTYFFLPALQILFLLLTVVFIMKDDKLVRDADRLR